MKPRDRVIAAMRFEQPADSVPHFERFELTRELFGQNYLTVNELNELSRSERDRKISENAELFARVAERFDYSIVRVWGIENTKEELEMIRRLYKLVGKERLIAATADATFAIPPGDKMVEFSYTLADHPEELHVKYKQQLAQETLRIKRLVEAGAECIYINSDYCFNDGPFLSPSQFSEFVTPYLSRQTKTIHQEGAFAIKHTDGNILPILEEMLLCQFDVLQSLDPQAGIDLGEIKRFCGDRVCLAGNVDCSVLQAGTPEEVTRDARRALSAGKPGGGYIFMSSNTIFEGVPLENYLAMWDVWKEEGKYFEK